MKKKEKKKKMTMKKKKKIDRYRIDIENLLLTSKSTPPCRLLTAVHIKTRSRFEIANESDTFKLEITKWKSIYFR